MKDVKFLGVTIIVNGKVEPGLINLGAITLKRAGREYILDIVRTMLYFEDGKTRLECKIEEDSEIFDECKYDLTVFDLDKLTVAEVFVATEDNKENVLYEIEHQTLELEINGVETEISLSVEDEKDSENKCGLHRNDVLKIAKDLNFVEPTNAQVNKVLSEVDAQADSDPTGWWGVWIEDLLYNLDLEKE